MGVFQTLLLGKTGQPPMVGLCAKSQAGEAVTRVMNNRRRMGDSKNKIEQASHRESDAQTAQALKRSRRIVTLVIFIGNIHFMEISTT